MNDLAMKPEHAVMKQQMFDRLVKLSSEMRDKVDLKTVFDG
jgi:hypothetical protein